MLEEIEMPMQPSTPGNGPDDRGRENMYEKEIPRNKKEWILFANEATRGGGSVEIERRSTKREEGGFALYRKEGRAIVCR